jgi:DNA-binding NarL/FixJ family response regulator
MWVLGDGDARVTVRAMPESVIVPTLVDQRAAGTVRVVIAHGRRLVRAGLRLLLEREAGIAVVAEAATGDEAVALARQLAPHVVLVDVHLPGLDCVQTTRQMLAGPAMSVMVLTESETDARVLATLRAGAAGLLLEDREPAELVRAVRLLGHGRRPRPRRSHPKQPAPESLMLNPKVIQIPRRRHGGR